MAIDHHGTFTGKLYMHRDTNLDSCPDNVWIEHGSALGHVDYLFAETIGAWFAALLEPDHAPGRVLGDCAGTVGGRRRRR